jgi:hypothetical protein
MRLKISRAMVAVGVVSVLCLVSASMAGAAEFTTSKYPTTFESKAAKGSWKFTTEGGTAECASTASGTLSAASSTATFSATYTECSAFGFLNPTVNTEGCDYLVHVNSGSGDTYAGKGDTVCPAGKSFKITAGTCALEIPAQAGSVSIEYKNDTVNKRIEGNVTGSSITYKVTQDGFGCPFSGTGHKLATVDQTQAVLIGGTEKPVHIG